MTVSLRVLVAEDQALIAALIEAILADQGYRVTVVYTGLEAISALNAKASAFDLLVTDIRMGPGPDGWAVAAEARALMPEIAIIYMTGDSMDEWRAKGMPDSALPAKPFSPEAVLGALSNLRNVGKPTITSAPTR